MQPGCQTGRRSDCERTRRGSGRNGRRPRRARDSWGRRSRRRACVANVASVPASVSASCRREHPKVLVQLMRGMIGMCRRPTACSRAIADRRDRVPTPADPVRPVLRAPLVLPSKIPTRAHGGGNGNRRDWLARLARRRATATRRGRRGAPGHGSICCCITASWRRMSRGGPRSRLAPSGVAARGASAASDAAAVTPSGPAGRRWADLMRRAFEVDVLACPRCGGRLRLIALTIVPPSTGRSGPPSATC